MINIENLINDGNPDIFEVYDDGKCKYNSFEVRLNTNYLIDGIIIDITGYGADEEDAVNNLKYKVGNSWSKLQEILKPVKINDFYIIPDVTKFVCTIKSPMSYVVGDSIWTPITSITVEDAVLRYDNELLAYTITSEQLDKKWIYATIAPYVTILKILDIGK